MTQPDTNSRTRHYFFAGGGTGGHIYPAIAIAQEIKKDTAAEITFLCSKRAIDSRILAKTGFNFTPLPGRGLSLRPDKLACFITSFCKSYRIARKLLGPIAETAVVIGTGGFISAPVILAAHKLKIPIAIVNVDIVPGRANKLLARFAKEIFVQFDETKDCFTGCKANINVTGCPLRAGFTHPEPSRTITDLGLDENKKIILVTGASSGSANINSAVCALLDCLDEFNDWQIVHLTGTADYDRVCAGYKNAKISHKIIDYYDDMPNLLAAADLVIGRAGAVSIAEYAAASAAVIALPYPYHKDRHQYLNAAKLVDAGAAVIVDDKTDYHQTAKALTKELLTLLKDNPKRKKMKTAAKTTSTPTATKTITEKIVASLKM